MSVVLRSAVSAFWRYALMMVSLSSSDGLPIVGGGDRSSGTGREGNIAICDGVVTGAAASSDG